MFVVFYLWVRAMLLGVWCMKWYSRNGGRLNIRICVSGSHVGNDEQGVVLYFYVIVYDSRMSLSNVSLPIWHWCSPSVLPLTHPSPFSPKPALEEPRRTSHPERGGKKKSVFFFSNPTLLPLHDHQVLEPEVVQVEEKAQLLQVLLLLPRGRLSAGQLPKTQTRETLWGV